MAKTLREAANEFNSRGDAEKGGYEAEVVADPNGEYIRVLFLGLNIGHVFDEVSEFEDWAYEGGDSV